MAVSIVGRGCKEPSVIDAYSEERCKISMRDVVSHYRARYNFIKGIISKKMGGVVSINKFLRRGERSKAHLIGMVYEKRITKNGNLFLVLEDPTGYVNAIVCKSDEFLFKIAKELIHDEVIGVEGDTADSGMLFVKKIIFPDKPLFNELKTVDEDICAAFISDIHVGSKMFLEREFLRFIDWINGAHEVKYLFIVGDLVDGVGVYPDQDKELYVFDIYEQYKACAGYLSRIRKDVKIIICPGNHDAVRIEEPQPIFNMKYSAPLFALGNVMVVGNPAMVRICESGSFPGFDVLMYHGYSFDYFFANIDRIRVGGGYSRADELMRFLLEKRHLAPTHGSSVFVVDDKKDGLVINDWPDFFVSGHIHKSKVGFYGNVSLISCSCWQSKTSFQERVGHVPEPARVPVVNLRTRDVRVLRFDV